MINPKKLSENDRNEAVRIWLATIQELSGEKLGVADRLPVRRGIERFVDDCCERFGKPVLPSKNGAGNLDYLRLCCCYFSCYGIRIPELERWEIALAGKPHLLGFDRYDPSRRVNSGLPPKEPLPLGRYQGD